MTTLPYHILPALLPEEYESLRASIAERGVDIPIIVDQEGNIIDGVHRQRACDELGIYCPREVRQFGSEAEKFELVLRANCRRRQLSQRQKRELITVYLCRDPQIADNTLGNLIGVSKNTVADVREELIATRQIDKFETLRGGDGKERPVKYKKIIANTPKEAEAALEVIGDLPENCGGKTLDVITAKRRARRNQTQQRIDQECELFDDQDIRLYHCRFQDLDDVAKIKPGSAPLVLPDIPYDDGFLPQVPDLGECASRWLVEGGLLAMYSGIMFLDEVLRSLGEHLKYSWTCNSVWIGDANRIRPRQVINRWKPVVIFSKGPWQKRRQWRDVCMVNEKEKEWHPWQQPLKDVEHWIRQFTKPGDLVVDPCGGGFTAAVACYRLGRRFIGCDIDKAAVVRGQQRLAEEQAHRNKVLEDLQVWIEDSEDFMQYYKRYPKERFNGQENVQYLWTNSGLDATDLPVYLHLLPESHRVMWKSLAG